MKGVKFQKISIYMMIFCLIGAGLVSTISSDETTLGSTKGIIWWNYDWQYCKTIHIDNSSNNFQMLINVSKYSGGDIDCNGHCNDDFNDIRFLDIDNTTVLDYWTEYTNPGNNARIWVELPADVEADNKIMMYYGNPNASSISNGTKTFVYFDDFSTNPIGKSQYVFFDNYAYDGGTNSIKLGRNSDNQYGEMRLILTDSNCIGSYLNNARAYVQMKGLYQSAEGRTDSLGFVNQSQLPSSSHAVIWKTRTSDQFSIRKWDNSEDFYVNSNDYEPFGDFWQVWYFKVSNHSGDFQNYRTDLSNYFHKNGIPSNSLNQQWDAFRWYVNQGVTYIGKLILMNYADQEPSILSISPEKQKPSPIVYVDDDYNSSTPGWQYDHFDVIQDGINAVAEQGTMFVNNGIYYEHISINKPVNLIGEDKNYTIIDGEGIEEIVWIFDNFVNISNFTFQNCGNSIWDSGVHVWSNSNSIKNNIFQNSNISISGNENLIIGNNILNYNGHGIFIRRNSNIIEKNIISNNSGDGIHIDFSADNNIISDNSITNNQLYGISITYGNSDNNHIYHNIFNNNNINAYDDSSNYWDDGFPSGGNIWDDYYGLDENEDGIGDNPYDLPGGNNQDLYPLGIFNEQPIAEFIYSPSNPSVDETVMFIDESVDNDGSIIDWTWEFGDGNNSYDQHTTHQYSNAGIYTVTLTVMDNHYGTDTISKIILIGIIPYNISTLDSGWNLKSLPGYDGINKNDLLIFYNDCYYTWIQAVENNIIVDYVFGWNGVGQHYVFADVLFPTEGYWIFAYGPCMLKMII